MDKRVAEALFPEPKTSFDGNANSKAPEALTTFPIIDEKVSNWPTETEALTVVEQWLKTENGKIDIILPVLITLTNLQYEQVRKKVSEKAGIRTTKLDEIVNPKNTGENNKPAVAFPEIDEWEHRVDGASLFEEAEIWIKKYIVLNDGDAYLIALWVGATWLSDIFRIAAILSILSPTKGSGKTSLIDILYQIVCRPIKTSGSGITVPVTFRINASLHPTLLIDEAEKLSGIEGAQDLIGLFNEGHRKGGKVFRCNEKTRQVEAYDPFGFRVLAAIGTLKDTILDRSIIIPMARKSPASKTARFFMNEIEREGLILARKYARWTSDNKGQIKILENRTVRPDWLKDRACDNYGPLFQIANAAGEHCLKKCLEIVKNRQTQTDEATGTPETLIKDIKGIFEDEGNPKDLQTSVLLDKLILIESSPWGDWKGHGLTKQGLAKMLKPFGIKPQLWRNGPEVLRGYIFRDFQETFERYALQRGPLEPLQSFQSIQDKGAVTVEAKKHEENQEFENSVTGVTAVTVKTRSNEEGTLFNDVEVEEMP